MPTASRGLARRPATFVSMQPTARSLVTQVAAAGMFAGLTLALTWLAVASGLVAKTPEDANSLSLSMLVLPFVSSAFVPTNSMPAGLRWFAHAQPFTPIIETFRGLLTGASI